MGHDLFAVAYVAQLVPYTLPLFTSLVSLSLWVIFIS